MQFTVLELFGYQIIVTKSRSASFQLAFMRLLYSG